MLLTNGFENDHEGDQLIMSIATIIILIKDHYTVMTLRIRIITTITTLRSDRSSSVSSPLSLLPLLSSKPETRHLPRFDEGDYDHDDTFAENDYYDDQGENQHLTKSICSYSTSI